MANFPQQLGKRIRLLNPSGATDDAGQPDPAGYVDIGGAWADVRNLTGLEIIKADALAAPRRASFRIRKRTGVNSATQLTYEGVTYQVKAVVPDDDGVHMDLVGEAIQ